MTTLAGSIREDLLQSEGVRKMSVPRRGVAIFSTGMAADHVYFLDAGLVKIERTADSGRDLLLSVVAPGDIFGEHALIGEGAYPVTATTMDPVVAYVIPTAVFQRFCERRPEINRHLMKYLIARKDELEAKIEHLCYSDVKQRIVHYLSELVKLNPSTGGNSVIHISQNELASLVGATRETTSTTLNALARQGVIALGHRLVMVPSVEQLRQSLSKSASAAGPVSG